MSDDRDSQRMDGAPTSPVPDPLGIVGWIIGGKYKILAYVGGGGFGEVYSGFNVNLAEQRLILKFFKRVQEREKFSKEAKILCLLDHPHICRVIDFLPDEGAVVVPFIDGRDGAKILKESGPLPPAVFLKVARALTSAMAYAHEKKIAHRDIKPGNIIVDKTEYVYLIDFGIAKEIGGDATKTGYQTLTPMFAAPERQAGDRDYNPFLSDIYETGITLFNFITNSLPYRNPISPSVDEWGGAVADKLSPELRRILKKATHPEPSRRYRSMAELAEELETLEEVFGRKRKRSTATIAAIGAVLAVVALIVGWLVLKSPAPQKAAQPTTPPVTKTEKPRPIPPVDTARTKPAPAAAEKQVKLDTAATSRQQSQAKPIAPPPTEKQAEKPPVTPTAPMTEKPGPAIKPGTPEKQTEKAVITPPPVSQPQPGQGVIRVTPSAGVSMTLGAVKVEPGRPFEIAPGIYDLVVMTAEYPVYTYRLTVKSGGGNDLTVDLINMFGAAAKVDLQIALSPPSDNHILELSFNGRKRTITKFPFLGLEMPAGVWNVAAHIVPLSQPTGRAARVDSCVVFPYGGGPRFSLRGERGMARFGGSEGEAITNAPLVIYWSEY